MRRNPGTNNMLSTKACLWGAIGRCGSLCSLRGGGRRPAFFVVLIDGTCYLTSDNSLRLLKGDVRMISTYDMR